MELIELSGEIRDAMTKAIAEARTQGEDYACVTVNTNDGYIDLSTDDENCMDAVVWHDSGMQNANDNLEQWCIRQIPCWYDVEVQEDEPAGTGVDAGFASQNDFINYLYR